jgi:flavin reductase (DIM6/NTAB) family NADH-FMN oxidoreductase RutF
MIIHKEDIQQMEQRYRATFINALAGYRQAVLIGTQSISGITNLAIFNSLIHIGANPALYAFVCRPDTVRRDTLKNIMNTQYYTLNYVPERIIEKAHQTAAKYDANISEFDAVGLTPVYKEYFKAPFVLESPITIGMKLVQKIDITINNTVLIIGTIETIDIPDNIIGSDGFIALEKETIAASVGLDAYYTTDCITRLSYAKTDTWPVTIR